MKLWELPGSINGEAAENPAIRSLVFEAMRANAPILEYAEFYQVTGNSDSPRKAVSASGGQVRTINDTYPDNKIDPSFGSVTLVTFGDIVQTDIANHRRGIDVNGARLNDVLAFAKNMGKNLQYNLVNNTTWNGFLKSGFIPTARVTSFSSDLSTDAKRKNLVMLIKEQMADVGNPDCVIMDVAVLSEISGLAMEYVKYGPNNLGGFIPSIDGVPIVLSGYNSSGTKTLPATTGTGSNATKIIVARFGEKSDLTLATSVGLQVKDLGLVGTAYETLVELDIDAALLDNTAVAVIDEIQNP